MSCNIFFYLKMKIKHNIYNRLTGRPAFPGANIHDILAKNKKCDI